MEGMEWTEPFEPVSRLVTPSIVIFFELLRPPAMYKLPMEVGEGDSRESEVSTMPGRRATATTSASTVTDSEVWPILSSMEPRERWTPEVISMLVCSYLLKPGVLILRV